MPNFPIDYAKRTPPAATPTVPAQLDVREGGVGLGQRISAAGSRFAKFGMDLLDKVQKAQDSTEMDTLTRKFMEDMNAYAKLSDATADPEARAEHLKALEARINAYKPSRRVEPAWNHFVSTALPQNIGKFQWWNHQNRLRQIKQDAEINRQGHLVSGDEAAHLDLLYRMHNNGLITLDTMQTRARRFPADSAMAKVEDAAADENWKLYDKRSAIARKKRLTVSQKNDMNRLTALRDRQVAVENRKGATKILFRMTKAADVEPKEKAKIALEMRKTAETLNLSPSQAAFIIDRIERWGKNEETTTDPITFADMTRAVLRIGSAATTADRDRARDLILSNMGSLSNGDAKRLLVMLETGMDSGRSGAVGYAVKISMAAGLIGVNDEAEFTMAISDWINTREKPPSPKEIRQYGLQLSQTWEKRPETGTSGVVPLLKQKQIIGFGIARASGFPVDNPEGNKLGGELVVEKALEAGWLRWYEDPRMLAMMKKHYPSYMKGFKPPKRRAGPRRMTPGIANQYLQRAGDDRAKAEAAAKADGYVW